ncbi:hypothetical protein HDV05_004146 [Chytridiales sp. JEL 0842]|nr:hypothetical protein HDV05_004146 [Chytridiales sp. JEL 0842]
MLTASEIWLKEVSLPLDEAAQAPVPHTLPVPDNCPIWESSGQHNHHHPGSSASQSEQTAPLSSVYHLSYAPRSFIVWRLLANHRVLELRRVFLSTESTSTAAAEDSFSSSSPAASFLKPDISTGSIPVHFLLPAPILSVPRIAEDVDTLALHVMLLTRAGTFYRLVFPFPDLFAPLSQPGSHLLNSDACVVQVHQIRALEGGQNSMPSTPSSSSALGGLRGMGGSGGKSARLVHFPDLDTICVGCSNGSIIQVDCPRTYEAGDQHRAYREHELSDQNYMSQLKTYVNTPMKLLTAFRGRSDDTESLGNPSQPISLDSVAHPQGVFLFALCRDYKIRMYNTVTHQHVKTLTIPGLAENMGSSLSFIISSLGSLAVSSSTPSTSNSTDVARSTHNYLKVFGVKIVKDAWGNEGLRFNFAVFAPSYSDVACSFSFYEGEIESTGALKTLDYIGIKNGPTFNVDGKESLVDFQIVKATAGLSESVVADFETSQFLLWTLWDRRPTSTLRYAHLEIETSSAGPNLRTVRNTGDRWIQAVGKTMEMGTFDDFEYQRETKGVSEILIDALNRQNHFSARTLLLALDDYAKSVGIDSEYQTSKDLSDLFKTGFLEVDVLLQLTAETVGSNLEKDGMGAADYEAALKQEWMNFFGLCYEVNIDENVPAGLSIDSKSGVLVIAKRGTLSTVRNCDYAEVLVETHKGTLSSAGLLMAPEEVISTAYPKLKSRNFRSDLSVFFEMLDCLKESVNGDSRSALLNSVRSLLISPAKTSLHAQLLELADQHMGSLVTDSERSTNFVSLATSVEDPDGLFKGLFNLLAVSPRSKGSHGSHDIFNASHFSSSLVVRTFMQIMEARSELAKDVVLVQIAMTKLASTNSASLKLPMKTLAKSLAMLHSIFYTDCLAKIYVRAKAGDESDTAALPISLDTRENFPPSALSVEPLYRPLMRIVFDEFVKTGDFERQRYIDQLSEAVWNVFVWIGAAVSPKAETFAVSTDVIQFVNVLMQKEYVTVASELLHVLPRSPAMQYLEGVVQLKLKDYEKSRLAFEKAAGAFLKGASNDLGVVLASDVRKKGVLGFYEHVIGIYEEHRVSENVIAFARLALSSISEKERKKHLDTVKNLWKMVFTNCLETLQLEEAYSALISIPDTVMRRYCLRRFVTVVCENGQVEALCTRYTFAELQSEVEETLLFKAKTRNVVPLPSATEVNPNYHQYLYSYYIFRGEYRNASYIMYDYARRLGSVSALDIGGKSLIGVITEQARSYLASMNALALVGNDFSYLVYASDALDVAGLRGRKRRKTAFSSKEVTYGVNEYSNNNISSKVNDVIDLQEIRKEYSLALAKLNLTDIYRDYEVTAGLPDPEDAVTVYTQSGNFDAALNLALLFEMDLETIFGAFGARCATMTHADLTRKYIGPRDSVAFHNIPVCWGGTQSEKAWRLLQVFLDKHDSAANNFSYRRAAIERALEANRNIALPPWLVDFYKKQFPEDLIRIYLKYGLLEKCASFCTYYVQEQINSLPGKNRILPVYSARWMPFTLFDQLILALNSEIKELQKLVGTDTRHEYAGDLDHLETLLFEFEESLESYFDKIREETRVVAGDGAADTVPQMRRSTQPMAPKSGKPLVGRGEVTTTSKTSASGGNDVFSRLGPAVAPSSAATSTFGSKPATSAVPEFGSKADAGSKPTTATSFGFGAGSDAPFTSSTSKSGFDAIASSKSQQSSAPTFGFGTPKGGAPAFGSSQEQEKPASSLFGGFGSSKGGAAPAFGGPQQHNAPQSAGTFGGFGSFKPSTAVPSFGAPMTTTTSISGYGSPADLGTPPPSTSLFSTMPGTKPTPSAGSLSSAGGGLFGDLGKKSGSAPSGGLFGDLASSSSSPFAGLSSSSSSSSPFGSGLPTFTGFGGASSSSSSSTVAPSLSFGLGPGTLVPGTFSPPKGEKYVKKSDREPKRGI